MVFIRQIDFHSAEYSALAARHGSVFNQPAWLKIYRSVIVNGIFNQNNELIGAFNVYKASKFGFSYYLVPPYSPTNGLFFVNPAQSTPNRNTFEKEIHEAIANWFSGLKAFLKITAFPPAVKDPQPYYWNHFKVIPHVTYILSLKGSVDNLFENLTSEKRKSIRKAEKDGLLVRRTGNMREVTDLVLKTFARSRQKAHSAYLHSILFEFAGPANSFAYVAEQNGVLIGCTFCVHDATTAYYLFGGYDELNAHHGAGVSCMWRSILHAKEVGLQDFDFEGSMVEGVEKYFREFGGDLVPYYTVQKGWLPAEMLFKLKMRNRF